MKNLILASVVAWSVGSAICAQDSSGMHDAIRPATQTLGGERKLVFLSEFETKESRIEFLPRCWMEKLNTSALKNGASMW